MKFRTTRFGVIQCPGEVVMSFPEGVLGFPNEIRYILLEHAADGSPFKWLQSLENPDLAFIVVDPLYVDPRFRFEIDLDTARAIGTVEPNECAVLAIVNVPRDYPIGMTANLKAPLVINAETRIGRQMVLGSQAYSINTPIFPELSESEESYIEQKAVI